MNGYLGNLLLYREATYLGARTGSAYRPPGLREARLNARPVSRFQQVTPFGASRKTTPLHQRYSLQLSREMDFGPFSAMILDALRTDTGSVDVVGDVATYMRATGVDTRPQTFGACVEFSDGTKRRLRGLALIRVEWVFQGRRVIHEETEWAVTVCEGEGTVETETPLPHKALAAWQSSLSGSFNGETLESKRTLSLQMIAERDVEACQYTSAGVATRLAVKGSWSFLGRAILEMGGGDLGLMLGTPVTARLEALLASGSQSIGWSVPTGEAVIQAQPIIVNGQAALEVNWQALEQGANLFTTTEISTL